MKCHVWTLFPSLPVPPGAVFPLYIVVIRLSNESRTARPRASLHPEAWADPKNAIRIHDCPFLARWTFVPGALLEPRACRCPGLFFFKATMTVTTREGRRGKPEAGCVLDFSTPSWPASADGEPRQRAANQMLFRAELGGEADAKPA